MSYRTGISADARRVGGVLIAVLVALVTAVGYSTVDPGGVVRVRTALFVWSFVSGPWWWWLALVVTLGGACALVWFAPSLQVPVAATPRLDHPTSPAGADRLVSARATRLCVAAMVALAVFVASRMGLFHPWRALGGYDTFGS